MLKNNKGTILVVAVTAMMILIIIGCVCLQMYMNQSIMDSYDVVRKRVFYSAEGAAKATLGYIYSQNNIPNINNDSVGSGMGYLFTRAYSGTVGGGGQANSGYIANTSVHGQVLKDDAMNILMPFDHTMEPPVNVTVAVRRLTAQTQAHNPMFNRLVVANYFPANFIAALNHTTPVAAGAGSEVAYEIIAKATATHRTALHIKTISTTVHFYFYTVGNNAAGMSHKIRYAGWRVD